MYVTHMLEGGVVKVHHLYITGLWGVLGVWYERSLEKVFWS